MSTLAPSPLPHHRLHLPKPRRLNQLAFLCGAGGGAVAYLVGGRIAFAVLTFTLVWYLGSYGISRLAAPPHAARRRQWVVHVLVLPAAAIAATIGFCVRNPDAPGTAVLLGLVIAVAVQALVTQTALRGVVDDQQHDLRRRLGIE